ncbi:PKD domain-containing protein [Flavobacterium sp. NKUCC04_CG]|uniref:PKD domain-containing protein n=1 Tax=Flavobacterium sp. NKUCC04_CG TaxID=2842121 RepID=UPI001C5B92E1|nr:PKD domain-containing protein [Flavobacterium sp. NKUCC04_CG]MBW3520003.1 PKD domain-containing protein [Flavobacterium sp. NKUCC04_CG]
MKRKLLLLFISCVLLGSCYTETAVPITANFEYIVKEQDFSVPVILSFHNSSTGGDQYFWEFVGGTPGSSQDKNPGEVFYDKPGIYTIKLTVTNIDGEKDIVERQITILDQIRIDFDYQIEGSNYPPVAIDIANKTQGLGLDYHWNFEGGLPAEFEGVVPPTVIYENPGTYTVTLTVKNGQDVVELTREVRVDPDIVVDFDWDPISEDYDYQAPVVLNLKNHSENATSYQWSLVGTNINQSVEQHPTVIYNAAGNYQIKLTASNDKKSLSKIKTIKIHEDTNLYVLENIKLGISYAHNTNLIPAFYSTKYRKSFFSNELTPELGKDIDLAFYGLNSDFTTNKFISPDKTINYGLPSIAQATPTVFVNSQELCNCGLNFSESDFNSLNTDAALRNLSIEYSAGGDQKFNQNVPRIVLFKTADGRKGVIKVKQMVNQANAGSHIVCDIKVQKKKR